MDFSQIDGLDDLLGSLTVGAKPESADYASFVIYPAHRYSLCPGADICIWYKAALEASFQRLRALIQRALVKGGLGSSSRFADAVLFAYAITEPTDDRTEKLRRILVRTTVSDVSQFFIIPSSAFFEVWGSAKDRPAMSIGSVKLGPFLHAPFSGDVLASVHYRIGKTGVRGDHRQALDAKKGTICVSREPRSISVMDFDRLNIKGASESELALLNYYFDDVAEYWFEEFWREHLEWQVTLVASGADVLDKGTLYGLPGYTELSIFLGLSINGHGGTVSMIEEVRSLRDSIAKRFYNFKQDCNRIKDRWAVEVDTRDGPLSYFGSVVNLARYMVRSREMKLRGSTDEAFVLLITGLEALVADGHDSITKNISRRIAAITSLTESTAAEAARKEVAKLYEARSRFVHEAVPIDPSVLPILEHICERVYFTALRSQAVIKAPNNEDWRKRWLAVLDYLYAACCVDLPPEASALLESGIRRVSSCEGAEKDAAQKYGKIK
jgi:hypothetical protein